MADVSDFWRERLPATLKPADELAEGLEALKRLIAEMRATSADRNEASTRFQIIDRILVECLGYPRSEIQCEPNINGEYADYQVGQPLLAIWEAKREGQGFEIPVKARMRSVQKVASVAKASSSARDAINQVNSYCRATGCPVAAITNGSQMIAFLSEDFSGGYVGNAYIVPSLEHLENAFGRAWQLLSYPALQSGNLATFLDRSTASQPPEKMSSYIPNYPQAKERSGLQSSLNTIADLLLLNIEKQENLEGAFYSACYVESGGLSQNSTVSKSILAARYASLFEDEGVAAQPAKARKGKDTFTPDLLAEAISNKPIVLVGDVGVGKSSFIKHLKYVSAFEEFRRSIYVYIDLAFEGALSASLRDLVLNTVEDTLLEEHEIDVLEDEFVRRVYKKEMIRFERGVEGRLREVAPERYILAEIEHLKSLTSDRSEHLKRSIQYLASEKRKQIIIAIDNADKRSSEIQQDAFIIAQNIASTWKAAVFVSMRPSTYYTSKRAGALSAYQSRVFTIAPPRIDLVLEKRIRFAVEIAEGKRQLEQLQHVRLNLSSIVAVLKSVMESISTSDDVQIFLENITGGNVRAVIEFVAETIGSPNIDTEAAVRVTAEGGDYIFPVHDFWKVALKGEFHYFDPSKVLAANLFATQANDKSEHFLAPLILSFLAAEGAHRASEGFVQTVLLLSEMQSLGYSSKSCESCLRRLVNDRLIETALRVSFEEDEFGLYGELPSKFRINSAGAYYVQHWMCTISYLDAVVVDMQIYDEDVKNTLKESIRSLALADRLERAQLIRGYLTKVWEEMSLNVDYFDWEGSCRTLEWTFERVRSAVARRGR